MFFWNPITIINGIQLIKKIKTYKCYIDDCKENVRKDKEKEKAVTFGFTC